MSIRSSIVEIIGDKLIMRRIKRLKSKSAQSRVIRAGQSAAMTEISRGIRNAIDPKYKSVKKTIGRNTKKGQAKVGLGVGKRTKSKKERDSKRPGVGISKQNVHWIVLGTGKRTREKSGSTGAMPAIGKHWVQKGFKASKSTAEKKQRDKMREKVEQELQKA